MRFGKCKVQAALIEFYDAISKDFRLIRERERYSEPFKIQNRQL